MIGMSPDLIAFSVVILVVVLVSLVFYFVFIGRNAATKKGPTKKVRDKSVLLKEAQRRLAANPRDSEALKIVADTAFEEGDFEKALKTYRVLANSVDAADGLDEFQINLRYGLAALQMKILEEGLKALIVAKAIKPDSFEVNFNLGQLEYQRKAYEKAAAYLKQARSVSPDHTATNKVLGMALHRMKQPKEAAACLRKALDLEPNDKETMFKLAESYYEMGQAENALKIFTHLRPDPEIGPQAALFAGTINYNSRQYEKSIQDLEIGLRHPNLPKDMLLEMKYRLAAAYTQEQNLELALRQLKEIRSVDEGYKDVLAQISKLSEFSSNKNLQTYMVAPMSEFVTLCRNLTTAFFPKAKIKITDVTVTKAEYADILTEISTSSWDDIILFRFLRSTAVTGELFLRDMHARIKELKAGRGFCVTAGSFNPTARQFVEARLIDLIEKHQLLKAMENLN